MKKIYSIIAMIIIALATFGFVSVNAEETNLYDNTKLTYTNGSGFTYTDLSLTDGWYRLTIDGSLDNPMGYMDSQYYTGALTQGYTFTSTQYVKNIDTSVSNTVSADIYVIDGKFKFTGSTLDTINTTILDSNGLDLFLIQINELSPGQLTSTVDHLTYNGDVLKGWYKLTIPLVSMPNTSGNLMTATYTTGDGLTLDTIFGESDLVYLRNITTNPNFVAEVYIEDGYFKIQSSNIFDTTYTNVMNISLELIELDTEPVFNYSELTLEVPYYDIPSLNEIKAMLSATDNEDGDLTSSIQLVSETISDFQVGDPLSAIVEVFDRNSTSYQTDFSLLENYSLWVLNNGEYKKISSINQSEIDITYDNFMFYYDIENPSDVTNQTFITTFNNGVHINENYDGSATSFLSNQQLIIGSMENWSEDNKLYLVQGDSLNLYYATYSVSDSSGNISYVTVNLDLYDDYFGRFSFDSPIQDTFIDVYYDPSGYSEETLDIYLPSSWKNIDITSETDLKNYLISLGYDFLITMDYESSYFPNNNLSQMFYEIIARAILEIPYSNHIYYKELEDSSEYELVLVYNIIWVDNVVPSFETSPSRISVSNETQLTLQQLEDLLVYSDDSDLTEDVTLSLVSDTYTANYNTVGRYEVIFSAEDTSGNVAFHTIVIYVVDITPPLYTVDEKFVVVNLNEPIEESALESILIAHGIVVTELSFTVTILEEDYFDNVDRVGDYIMRLRIDYENDTSEIIDLSLQVIDQEPSIVFGLNLAQTMMASAGVIIFVAVMVAIIPKKKR